MAGRPVGSLKNPEESHRASLLAWIQVQNKIRDMVTRQLALIDKKISAVESNHETFVLDTQLQIMAGLRELMATATKVAESGIKANAAATVTAEEDPDAFMRGLQGGQGG